MWIKHFLRSLLQVPTPSIYALWPDSVNLIHVKCLWKQFRGLFSCGQERTQGVPFGFIDVSSARCHTRRLLGDSYCVVFFKSFPSPLVIIEATASPGRGLVCVIYIQSLWAEANRREFHTDILFTAKPFLLLEAGPCPTCDDLKCQWQKGVTDRNT